MALEGRDLLVKAKTGSGKTAAYAIPLLHKILKEGGGPGMSECGFRLSTWRGTNRVAVVYLPPPVLPGVKALILVPTKELCDQTRDAIKSLMYYCNDVCSGTFVLQGNFQVALISFIPPVADLAGGHMQEQIAKLREAPNIIVATPSRLVQHLQEGEHTPACQYLLPRSVLLSGRVTLKDTLQTLVVDEADLVLLNGYGDDIRAVIRELPTICQV